MLYQHNQSGSVEKTNEASSNVFRSSNNNILSFGDVKHESNDSHSESLLTKTQNPSNKIEGQQSKFAHYTKFRKHRLTLSDRACSMTQEASTQFYNSTDTSEISQKKRPDIPRQRTSSRPIFTRTNTDPFSADPKHQYFDPIHASLTPVSERGASSSPASAKELRLKDRLDGRFSWPDIVEIGTGTKKVSSPIILSTAKSGPKILVTSPENKPLDMKNHCLSINLNNLSGNDKVNIEEGDSLRTSSQEQLDPTVNVKLRDQFYAFFQPSDNKLAMKLFGNKKAVDREKRRQLEQGKWIIHPCSAFRFYWNLIMLILLITNLITLPVAIAFFSNDVEEGSTFWTIFNAISDTIFLFDIIVNFRTGIIKNDYADEIVLNPREIASHYLRTWFLLDLISSLPIDHIANAITTALSEPDAPKGKNNSAGRAFKFLRFAKLLSLLRLLRLSRLVRYVSQWEEFLAIANKFIGIFNLVLLMLLLGHWNACFQFLIPMHLDYPAESWVSKCRLKDKSWFEQYTWALFKAMSHMLSIGYGRFPPVTIGEAWITIMSMLSGATCYALFVGHAAALIQSFDASKRNYREKLKQVEEYMAYRKLPRALRQRITNYYEHRYQGKLFNEREILEELSECLREQIVNYNCRALVAAVPFFAHADHNFVSEVVVQLKHEVFQPGDFILREGTLGRKMYFIQEGIVDIILSDGTVATSLSDGSYFGEICLLTNARRSASVRAETYCYLYSLDQENFLEVLDNYPVMRQTMESVAAERLNKIGKNHTMLNYRQPNTHEQSIVRDIVSQQNIKTSEDESGSENSASNRSSGSFSGTQKSRTLLSNSFSKLASSKKSRSARVHTKDKSVSPQDQNEASDTRNDNSDYGDNENEIAIKSLPTALAALSTASTMFRTVALTPINNEDHLVQVSEKKLESARKLTHRPISAIGSNSSHKRSFKLNDNHLDDSSNHKL